MQIGIVGAGAMGSFVAREIARSADDVQLVIVDADAGRAAELAAELGPATGKAAGCDATDTGELGRLLDGCAAVVNAAQYDVNLAVMQACLEAGSHYLDLGGMFHMTRRQLAFAEAYGRAGLTAILGMGAAPGLTNVLARHACDQLESISVIAASFAAAAPAMPPSAVFVPPYSIRTIMQEFCEPSMQFLDGEIRAQPPVAGRRRIAFPAPIGEVDCVYTLHSEPATLPESFRDKGVREVTWRLGLPPSLETRIAAFAAAGLGRSGTLTVGDITIAPVDFLAACIEDHARACGDGNTPEFTEYGCVRIEVTGVRDGRATQIFIDCMYQATGCPPEVAGVMTGTPAALAALMLARGQAARPGVQGAEGVVPPALMIGELARRGFTIAQTTRAVL